MKLISEHLGEIIVALAGIALLVSVIVLLQGSNGVSGFFNSILSKLTESGNNMLDSINVPAGAIA